MEQNETDSVAAFDTLYTTNHIQILKILLSFIPADQGGELAVLIKFLELQHVLSFSKNNKSKKPELNICSRRETKFDLPTFLEAIQRYCTEPERQKIKQMMSFFRTMEMYKEMQGFMEMMPELTQAFGGSQPFGGSEGGEGNTSENASPLGGLFGGGGFDLSTLMKNMLTPEQQAMFEMFQANGDNEKE